MNLKILDKTYTIKKDPKISGGKFTFAPPEIIIGSLDNKEEQAGTLLHEVIEIILTDRDLRYQNYNNGDNGDLMFVFNHKEFSGWVKDLMGVLCQRKRIQWLK